MKRLFTFIVLSLVLIIVKAQTGTTAYEFMNIPTSAHGAAVGGNAVALIEDDITLMFDNPALISNVSHNTINFDFMSYMSGSMKLSAAFSRQWGQRGNWAVGAQVLNYGEMTETNEHFEEFGKMDFASPSCDLYANVTGLPYGDDIKRTLADQTMSPVRFTDTVGNIMKSGITTFIECGEGKVLSGLVRKTSKELSVYNVSDTASLAATAEAIK